MTTRSRSGATAPPVLRGSMTPAPWFGFWRGLLFALWPGQRWPQPAGPAPAWHAAAKRRRAVLLALVLAMAATAFGLRLDAQPDDAGALWWSTTALMTLLFAWAGVGCATALMGAWSLWRGDPHAPVLADARRPIDPAARTAIVMPIRNEDIGAVFSGLLATCESLAATGALKLFDVFVLSDTSDPALRIAEEQAWRRLCTMLGEPTDGTGRVHYRWRQRQVKRKAGNVADFCRRWGRRYRYMVVLDADSTMSGDTLVSLVRLMEANPRAGILQTLPQVAAPATLHARAQQFASRVTGRLFAVGMSWWQLGDAHYWGHNAIIRVEPFMRHCGLARLPGTGSLAGEILSHDFVEAALMGRMGFEVWLVPQLGGSWEQVPPNLLDELQRDRRWCQGNLQNVRLVAEPGWRSAHRAMFAVGALSYAVAPLWVAFVVIGFVSGGRAVSDVSLWMMTLALLVLPRALGAIAIALRGEAREFGGIGRLALGALIELLLSALQAPLRMLAHCVYVLGAITGLKLEWKSPPRSSEALPWGVAARRIGALVALPLLAGLGAMQRLAAVVLAPMLVPLTLAIPFTVLTGHPRAGRAMQKLGLLRTPEDARPPRPLRRAAECTRFVDLVPAPSALPAAGSRTPTRWAPAFAAAGVAVLAMSLPLPGGTPELPASMRATVPLDRYVLADLDGQRLPRLVETSARPKRAALPDRPARMIDDAVRRRAIEAVERAIAAEAQESI